MICCLNLHNDQFGKRKKEKNGGSWVSAQIFYFNSGSIGLNLLKDLFGFRELGEKEGEFLIWVLFLVTIGSNLLKGLFNF